MSWWQPHTFAEKIPHLEARARIVANVRAFFATRGYLEVETPALQTAPCMEPHIQAFRADPHWLHTSPEFAMKKLLVAGLPKIFQIAQVFRREEPSSLHSPAFSMLEWYQRGMHYKDMMQETIALIRAVSPQMSYKGKTCDARKYWEILTVREAVQKYAGIDIEKDDLKNSGVYISPSDDWDNALLKIIMDKVEPNLGFGAPAILTDYPVSMAALSQPKPENPRYAERFEVYVCGVELANAFGELTDAKAQRERFHHDVAARKKIYGDDYPVDEDFLKAIDAGLPPCSGNALGIDRLVMLATGAARIDLVQAAPVK